MPNVFSDRVRAARELRKLSQSELASKSGFQPSAISHFETGTRSPSFDNLKRLADALNVTTDYLLGRTNEMTLAGPAADKLYRHAEKFSDDDLNALESMAEVLARKNKERSGQK